MLAGADEPADAIEETELPAEPVEDRSSGDHVEPAPIGESRLQWLRRVTRKSYEDGGFRMILRRVADRIGGGRVR
jgi:hypothetical protein